MKASLLLVVVGAGSSAGAEWVSHHTRIQRDIIRPTTTTAEQFSVTLRRDHFDTMSPSWKMRAWIDTQYWNNASDAPVFLSMGGEGEQGPPGGQQVELAKAHGAVLFSMEHRYYGNSIPTPSFSTPNLRWLGTEQALADAASFVQAMNAKYGLSGPWVSFGGSYSGELSAWVRIKYPHLIYAAVASSAPVTANVDYDGYDGVIADALARELVGGSAACRSAVKAAFTELETRFDHDRASLQKTFNTCGAVVTDGDCFLLHDFVSDDFMGLVQYNNQMGAVNIASRCAEMLNVTTGTAFDRLVKITRERSGKDCVFDPDPSGVTDSISFSDHLKGYRNVSNPARSFPYQQCIDGAGHDQTCKPEQGCIFSPKYARRSFFQEQCAAAYGVTADQTDVAVLFNSANYGGARPGGSRIVFVNGDIDPFHVGGVLENTTALMADDVVALVVSGGSHCQDMGPTSKRDTPSMALVKAGKAALVAKWVGDAARGVL